ncbi:MAG: disulfide bond formation protein B [Candidatus Taylorbacteria bacterium]|nr:disulfide bond formation protein B [Candidatus Taylorbacteria bacterium]
MSQATFSIVLSWLTVFGQALVIILLVLYVTKKLPKVTNFFRTHAILFSFIVVLAAVLGSLTYSDIYMIEPCKLCWYQRIFMYPQFVILGLSLILKDTRAAFYALILSILGAPIALYHYLLQRGVVEAGCSVVGNYSVSCSQYFKLNLGYITIPLMAFTAFVMIITFLLIYRSKEV